MFDIKRDLHIYRYEVYEEWKRVISELKTDGQNYIVPYRLRLAKNLSLATLADPGAYFAPPHDPQPERPASGSLGEALMTQAEAYRSLPLATLTLNLKLSTEARDVDLLTFNSDIYFAYQMRDLMEANPGISVNARTREARVIQLMPIVSVDDWLRGLSPESVMRDTIDSIKTHCRYQLHGGRMWKLRTQVLLYALYGMYIPLQITKEARSLVLDNIQTGDFGFRDVRHMIRLEAIVTGDAIMTAVTSADYAKVVNEIDELLEAYGRPVTRTVPSSSWLRGICALVKTSPLFEKAS